jgi:hypothetical protein
LTVAGNAGHTLSQVQSDMGDTVMATNPYGNNLPIFPTVFYNQPSEQRIETVVERLVNRADGALMSNRATQAQYDAWSRALNGWIEEQYALIS